MPGGAVSVTRPGLWGNPFPASILGAQLAVSLFRELMAGMFDPGHLKHLGDPEFKAIYDAKTLWQERMAKRHGLEYRLGARHDLKGKDLACYCQPGAPCHADVLLEIANG